MILHKLIVKKGKWSLLCISIILFSVKKLYTPLYKNDLNALENQGK